MTERKTRRFEEGASHETKKPNHVRKLNFGQTILTLNTVQQFQGQKDGALIIDGNVARIPCTEKGEFVRKWIETHNARTIESDESSHSSPILGSFVTRPSEMSPIFGNRRKRTRGRDSSKNNAVDDAEYAHSNGARNQIDKVVFGTSSENKRLCKDSVMDKKENIRRNLFNFKSDVSPSKVLKPNVSPVLDKNIYSYKRRRRKFKEDRVERKALDRIENKVTKASVSPSLASAMAQSTNASPILDRNAYSRKRKRRKAKENNCVDTNMNSVISCNLDNVDHLEIKSKLMCSQTRLMLLKKLEGSFKNYNLESSVNKESKTLEDSISSDSPISEIKLNIEDSPKDAKDTAKMEIESSTGDSNDYKDVVNINSDTDKDVSDHIEDVDTQDAASTLKNCKLELKHSALIVATKSASVCSNNDSDETYFSNAERLRCTSSSVHLSQKISQISSQVNNLVNSKSSQSGICISMETSPQRMNPEPFMQLSLLDSGKKRRKPKRGSLSEKLQSLINRQISSVRMWRHQLKQTAKEGGSTPCVTVHVKSCVAHFSRQFLEGIVIEDPFKLLSRKEECNSVRVIKIMTIPEIAGKVEMGSKNIVQIFPPWEVLDDKEPILNVTYIKIVSNTEQIDMEEIRESVEHIKRPIFTEFDCPCIKAGKMRLSCRDRLSKPNIMEKLFNQE